MIIEFYEEAIINRKTLYNDELDCLFTLSFFTKKLPNKLQESIKQLFNKYIKKEKKIEKLL